MSHEHLLMIWDFILKWYWVPLTIVNITVIITILVENGNPPKTLAWIMVIMFVPFLGILLYFFFGQSFQREKYFKKIDKTNQQKILERWQSLTDVIQKDMQVIQDRIGDFSEVYQYLNLTHTSPPSIKNDVELLINGEQKFPKFLEALRNAKKHIHLEYYIFDEDEIGNQVIDLLITKAKEGLIVRVIVDDLGSSKLTKHAKRFQGTGVQFQIMLPVQFTSLANSNFRDHRKVLIVDGEIAFVGGINISDKYINKPGSDQLYWRDTSVMITGESASILQLRFWLSWMMTDGEPYPLDEKKYMCTNPPQPKEPTFVSFAFTNPGEERQSGVETLILAINLAKKKVQLCTPYFIPTDSFKTALMIAVSKGVEVEIMIPREGDSAIVQNASLSFMKPLLKRGIKVFLYEKGFIHAKTANIDNELAFIGTMNLDTRSFLINFEINAIIHNDTLLQQMDQQFINDREVSTEMTMESWQEYSRLKRGFASLCRLLAPLL